MKAIMVMFDSLNRHLLPNYGCDWVKAPNFVRLGQQTVTFDTCYAGSLPCMPARRELHTGRYNFMHRSWGPLEPFDDSMPSLLQKHGVYTHLISDHNHYWEDGGSTYHNRYSSWEAVRGQEGDLWKGEVAIPELPPQLGDMCEIPEFADIVRHDVINRKYLDSEEKQPQAQTFAGGLDFIERNKDQDNWFLQIETFDPHEPFYTQKHYQALYPDDYQGNEYDWPPYDSVKEDQAVVQHIRYRYAALLSMCDHYLGKVLDMMDRHDLWKDTMLIVNTDHGYLLGEKGWWSKTVMPVYNEIAHTPLFCWDPRLNVQGERRDSIVQTIDLAPTLLEFFGVPIPPDMQGKPLAPVVKQNTPLRPYALFGYHGGQANITDGHTVYMKGPANPANTPLYEYTLMPTHMRSMFTLQELRATSLSDGFAFTKSCPVMKIPAGTIVSQFHYGDRLYNLDIDPEQLHPIDDPVKEAEFLTALRESMRQSEAPQDEFLRLGIPLEGAITADTIRRLRELRQEAETLDIHEDWIWDRASTQQLTALLHLIPESNREHMIAGFKGFITSTGLKTIDSGIINAFVERAIPAQNRGIMKYLLGLAGRLY